MGSVSGLTQHERHICRVLGVEAMELVLKHKDAVHYTEGSERWSGLTGHGLIAAKGQYPKEADCSATATWALAQGLKFRFGLDDIVNGERWAGGYTGTLLDHGREVQHSRNLHHMDLVFYSNPFHVAVVVDHLNHVPIVISHGSEAGPFKLRFDYRPVYQMRRYI